ncbi:hypothetical protein MMC28_008634 [Mycoblastus sanguinarius]|nr:hypothetical protein [Mycoblastus sanguinarius]
MAHGSRNSAGRRGTVSYPRDPPDFSDGSSFIDDFNDLSDFEDEPPRASRRSNLPRNHGARGGRGMDPFDDYDEHEGPRLAFNPRHGGHLHEGDYAGLTSGYGSHDCTCPRGSDMRGPPRVPGVQRPHGDFGSHGVSPMHGRHIPQRPPTLPLASQRQRNFRSTFAGEDEDFGLGSGEELAGYPRGGRPDRFSDSREGRGFGERMGVGISGGRMVSHSSDMHGDMHGDMQGGSRYDTHGGGGSGGGQGRRFFGGREGRYGSYH